MKTLHPNWFFENRPDFEYKKYVLLAYLQSVQQDFTQIKLYPALADLLSHYRNLVLFKQNKEQLFRSFPQELIGFDATRFQFIFNNTLHDDALMQHLEEVIDFSLPVLKKHIEEGKEIYEFIEQEIALIPVGVLPVYRKEGYLFFNQHNIDVYEYAVSLFSHEDDQYRMISTSLVSSYKKSFVNTYENIKIDLMKSRKKLPNPATFYIETKLEYSVEATLMPITKRLLMKYVA